MNLTVLEVRLIDTVVHTVHMVIFIKPHENKS